MILSLSPEVRERLEHIERREGIPPMETVHQAVEVWSHLENDEERQTVGLVVMQLVARRAMT